MNANTYNPQNPLHVAAAEIRKQSGGIFSRLWYAFKLYARGWKLTGRLFKVAPAEMSLAVLLQVAWLAFLGWLLSLVVGISTVKAMLYIWVSGEILRLVMCIINPEYVESAQDVVEDSVSYAEYMKRRSQASK